MGVTAVLIFGSYRHTLTVARSLARAGMHVVLAYDGNKPPCAYSRHIHELWQHCDAESAPDQFTHELNTFLAERPDITCLFPVGESDIGRILGLVHDLPVNVKTLTCDSNSTRLCGDKTLVSGVIDELGIPQPRCEVASDLQSLLTAAESIGYPCIVKLIDSEFLLLGEKAIVYHDANAVKDDFANWTVEGKRLLVQSYVAGQRQNLYFFAWHGNLVALGQTQALRTDRTDGTGMTVTGITVQPDETLVGYCSEFVRHLDYSGPGCMQFLVAPDRSIHFLEHNARLGASLAAVYRTGLDLPRLMVEYAQQERQLRQSPQFPCKINIQFVWMTGDLIGFFRMILKEQPGVTVAIRHAFEMIRVGITSPVHLTWDWRDPIPAIVTLGRLFKSQISRMITSSYQRPNPDSKA